MTPKQTRAIIDFIHANGGKTIGEEDAERRAKRAASGTSGSAQDRNGLDPKGAGPTRRGMPKMSATNPTLLAELAERDWARLPERITRRLDRAADGCWNWTSPNSLVGRGRGYVSINGNPMLHHRAVWTLLRGPIPRGALLCHHCDNPRCANPEHLYVGDHKSNVRDMWERGRHWTQREPERAREVGIARGQRNTWAKGARNPKAKLSPSQVAEITASAEGSRALGRRYGVHRTTIQRIRKGALWDC